MATFIEDSKRSEYWEPSYEYGIIRQRKESAKPKGEQDGKGKPKRKKKGGSGRSLQPK